MRKRKPYSYQEGRLLEGEEAYSSVIRLVNIQYSSSQKQGRLLEARGRGSFIRVANSIVCFFLFFSMHETQGQQQGRDLVSKFIKKEPSPNNLSKL